MRSSCQRAGLVLVLFSLSILSHGDPVAAQSRAYIDVSIDPVTEALIIDRPDNPWLFRPGDDPGWADPDLDESDWIRIPEARLPFDRHDEYGWEGVGWFRLWFRVDPSVADRPLAFWMRQLGASEIFLDGRRIDRLGAVGTSKKDEVTFLARDPRSLVFPDSGEHLLAFRYSNFYFTENPLPSRQVGFGLTLGPANSLNEGHIRNKMAQKTLIVRYVGVMLSFAAMHLFLFLFSPKIRSNLYFAVFCIGIGTFIPLDVYTFNLLTDPTLTFAFSNLVQILGTVTVVSGLFLVYEIFYPRRPRHGKWLVLLALGLTLFNMVGGNSPALIQFLYLMFMIEVGRVVIVAIVRRKEGAWIVGTGFLIFAVAGSLILLRNLDWIPNWLWIGSATNWAFFAILVSMSIYLARNYARTNRALEERLIEVKQLSERALEQERRARDAEVQKQVLEARHHRKSQELEEARRLQLAMLPQELPELARLEVAAHMETASEVGGDYYDFSLSEDGELTIAVGDATGHGAKAGTMVATVKGLFRVLSHDESIVAILRKLTRTLKEMRLGRMYMALTLVKYKDGAVRIGSAGMPPALHYRARENRIEEISLPAMPLGSFPNFPYQERELRLEPGDALILMSDGLPEMFNQEGEIFDYAQTRIVAEEAGGRSPEEVIAHLLAAGRAWAAGRPNDDDITLFVLRQKSAA